MLQYLSKKYIYLIYVVKPAVGGMQNRPTPSKGSITQEESIDLQFKESNKSVSES